jgi:hypothetical protein
MHLFSGYPSPWVRSAICRNLSRARQQAVFKNRPGSFGNLPEADRWRSPLILSALCGDDNVRRNCALGFVR